MTYRQRQRRQGERRVETMTAAKSQGSESCEQGVHGFIKGLHYKDQTREKSRTYQNQKCFTILLLFSFT